MWISAKDAAIAPQARVYGCEHFFTPVYRSCLLSTIYNYALCLHSRFKTFAYTTANALTFKVAAPDSG